MPTAIGTALASARGEESIMPSLPVPPPVHKRHQSAENGTGVARPFNDLLIFFGREPAHDVIALVVLDPGLTVLLARRSAPEKAGDGGRL
jgi:hypothetical protein